MSQVLDHSKLYEMGLMRRVALDSTAQFVIYLDEGIQTITKNGPGGATDTITYGPDVLGNSFRQTLTYTGTAVTGISQWIKQ